MHCEPEVFPALKGNKSTEQETSSSVLALIPRAQQSQQIRKSSPPTKGLNESQERFWLNDKGTNGEVKLEAHTSHEAHPAGTHNPLSVAEHGALTSISAFPTHPPPPPPYPRKNGMLVQHRVTPGSMSLVHFYTPGPGCSKLS